MKGGREHRVPLSDAALAIVEQMAAIRSGDFCFPGGRANRPLSNMALLMLLRRTAKDDPNWADFDRARLPLDVPRLGGRAHQLLG